MTYAIMTKTDTPEAMELVEKIHQLLSANQHCSWQHFNHPQVLIIMSISNKETAWLAHVVEQASYGRHRILYYTEWLEEAEKDIIRHQKKNRFPGARAFHNPQKLLRIFSTL